LETRVPAAPAADARLVLVIEDEPSLAELLRDALQADGFSVCREVRAFSTVPMIMITARAEQIDRLLGLELGADDYICKPFHPREVVARLRALLRRTLEWNAVPPAAVAGGLSLDEEGFSASWDGHELGLTPVEFRLLKALSARPGRVLSRDQLLDAIYVDHRVVSDRTVDSHVKNLRRKLAEVGADPIQAVYGVGYKFQPA
jgi:two-component system, OmpR family, response regulator BaeR